MPIFFSITTDRTPGPELAIRCPICKEQDVLAGSYDETETVKLLWVMPIMHHRNTIVACSGCNTKLYSRLKIEQLHHTTPDELDRSLYPQGGMLVVTLFLISLMIFCVPLVGLVPAIFVPIANRRASGANRIVGYIPLVLAIGYNVWFFIALALGVFGKGP